MYNEHHMLQNVVNALAVHLHLKMDVLWDCRVEHEDEWPNPMLPAPARQVIRHISECLVLSCGHAPLIHST